MKEKECYFGDEKVILKPVTDVLALKVNAKFGVSELAQMLNSDSRSEENPGYDVIDALDLVLVANEGEHGVNALTMSVLEKSNAVEDSYEVFRMPNAPEEEFLILPRRLRVQFNPETSEEEILKILKKLKLVVLEKDEFGTHNYLLEVPATEDKDAIELANYFQELDTTEYAEPDWIMALSQLATTNDPMLRVQWALEKMNVYQAWDIHKGSNNITIAIVDEGVQTSHPDLASKIVTPYDAVDNNNNQEPNPWNGHGTSCAGIAAASSNNRRGIAGVGQNCKIMPIRIAYSRRGTRRWITSASIIARGIRTAAARGADIISNSWGGGPYSNTIRDAFKYAQNSGRGGKGCVLISATGNDDINGISYPAKYIESMACGASNQWDQRKSKSSRDGENWWGSNYGQGLDFLAPGVKIATTDITSSAGYVSGDYMTTFNGTSAATPNAAGVAGLVLSKDPNLRFWEVRDILRHSSKDLGSRGWNPQFGWGRIDAYKALKAASILWHKANLRLTFLGPNRDTYMKFNSFKFTNCGINSVLLRFFKIRSLDSRGNEIDSFTYEAQANGTLRPGLSRTGDSGDHITFKDILLKAEGNRSNYKYRWNASWNFTYWRPSNPISAANGLIELESFNNEGISAENSATMSGSIDEMAPVSNHINFTLDSDTLTNGDLTEDILSLAAKKGKMKLLIDFE